MTNVRITHLTPSDESTAAAISSLLEQLSPACKPITEQQLALMVANPATAIFLLQDHNHIIGMLTVGNYFSPTGRKAWIEDVVVERYIA